MENKKKRVQLVFDPRIARRLLKKNGEWKFCPFCASPLSEGCECNKNIIVDIKANRENIDKSIFAFYNDASFRRDFKQLMDEIKTKDETEFEHEQLMFDEY